MNKALEHIKEFIKSEGYEPTNDNIFEWLYESTIYDEVLDQHRWYTLYFKVSKINEMFIGWNDGIGDDGNRDSFEFDPNRIYEVEPYEITVVKYKKVGS